MRIDIHSSDLLQRFEHDFRQVTVEAEIALKVCYRYLQIGSYNAKVDKAINTKIMAKYGFSIEVWEDPYETFRFYYTYKNDEWNVSVIAKGWPLHGVFIYGSDDKECPSDKIEEMIESFYTVFENVKADLKAFSEKYKTKLSEREHKEEEERWLKGE